MARVAIPAPASDWPWCNGSGPVGILFYLCQPELASRPLASSSLLCPPSSFNNDLIQGISKGISNGALPENCERSAEFPTHRESLQAGSDQGSYWLQVILGLLAPPWIST